jgi:hypothetical protein
LHQLQQQEFGSYLLQILRHHREEIQDESIVECALVIFRTLLEVAEDGNVGGGVDFITICDLASCEYLFSSMNALISF